MDLWLLGALIYAVVGVIAVIAAPRGHLEALCLTFAACQIVALAAFRVWA